MSLTSQQYICVCVCYCCCWCWRCAHVFNTFTPQNPNPVNRIAKIYAKIADSIHWFFRSVFAAIHLTTKQHPSNTPIHPHDNKINKFVSQNSRRNGRFYFCIFAQPYLHRRRIVGPKYLHASAWFVFTVQWTKCFHMGCVWRARVEWNLTGGFFLISYRSSLKAQMRIHQFCVTVSQTYYWTRGHMKHFYGLVYDSQYETWALSSRWNYRVIAEWTLIDYLISRKIYIIRPIVCQIEARFVAW